MTDRGERGNEAQVIRAAQKLGYRPNLAARYLSSRKRITIGRSDSHEVAYFYDEVREGSLKRQRV